MFPKPFFAALAFCLVFLINVCYGQFSERRIEEVITVRGVESYDTTSNFNIGKDVDQLKRYVGQKIIFLPLNFSYERFKPADSMFKNFFYPKKKVIKRGKRKKIEVSHYRSPIEDGRPLEYTPSREIENKIFTVIDFNNTVGSDKVERSEWGANFTLYSHSTDDTLIWRIPELPSIVSDAERYALSMDLVYPPVFVVSFVDKIRNKYIDNKWYAKRQVSNNDLVDLKTSRFVTIFQDSVWVCTDLTMITDNNSIYKQPFLIFSNNEGEEIKVRFNIPMGDFNNKIYEPDLFDFDSETAFLAKKRGEEDTKRFLAEKKRLEDEAEKQIKREKQKEQDANKAAYRAKCVTKFGKKNGGLIADGKVQIGMSKDMCRWAWGEPDDINRTILTSSTHEQWVYSGGSYLYFEEGKLTAIQN